MKNSFEALIKTSTDAIKYWWAMLIVGLVIFAMGILVFVYPMPSYLGLTAIFGWLVLFSGLTQLVLYFNNKHIITNRGWMIFGGIIEIALGLILIFNLTLSEQTLPIYMGFWMLFRSFSMIGFGSDMRSMRIGGSTLTIFTAAMLMIVSLMILIHPTIFGIQAVIIWVGISLMITGLSAIILALQLRNAHKFDS